MPVRFHSCFLTRFEPRWGMQRHTHDDYHELYIVIEGQARTTVKEDVMRGGTGDVLFHPRGLDHFCENCGDAELAFLHLRWIGGDDLVRDWSIRPCFDRLGHVRVTLEWMLDLYPHQEQDGYSRATLDALTTAVLCEINRLRHSPGSEIVERTRRFIRAHLDRSISVDDLAAASCLSKFYFIRQFKKAAGVTPKRFINSMRVEAAEHLLLKTDMTLEAIATEVGFSDASYFSHVFHRMKGHPPGALRKKSQEHPEAAAAPPLTPPSSHPPDSRALPSGG